jgi:hypothetical protein
MAKRNKVHRLPYDKRPAQIAEQERADKRLLERNLEQDPATPEESKRMVDKASREVNAWLDQLKDNK